MNIIILDEIMEKEICLIHLGFNTPPLGAVKTGGVGDLFPRIRKDLNEKSSIPRRSVAGIFIEMNKNCNFQTIYEIFKDVIYKPTEEKIENIIKNYENENNKYLYGYFIENKLIGIMGIEEKGKIEILHFGIHKEYRNKKYGTELINYAKNKYKNNELYLTTDEDAVIFYIKNGFKAEEYYEERNGEKYKRYRCEI